MVGGRKVRGQQLVCDAIVNNAYVQTRSGAEFSPYMIGPPIVAPDNFDLAQSVQAAQSRMEEAALSATAADPDEPDLVFEDAALYQATESLGELFASVAPTGQGSSLPARQSHASKHSHKRRRRKRVAEELKAGICGNISLKKVAIKRLREARTLTPASELERKMSADTGSAMAVDPPMETRLSFGMEEVHVASTGFIGTLLSQSEDDRRSVTVQELRNRDGWEYVAWDGK